MKVTKWASDHRDRLELAYLFRYAPRVLGGMNVPKYAALVTERLQSLTTS